MTTRGILTLIIIAALAVGGWWLWSQNQPVGTGPMEDSGSVLIHEDVKLLTPRAGETVRSPLVIKGEAKTWYFEGSFGVKLIGPSGKVLAEHYVQAQGDWMTTEFVPFEGTLQFVSDEEGMGQLVLQKDNPSDMRELDESVSVPVRIVAEETMSVKAFFAVNEAKDGSIVDCSKVEAVTRIIPKTLAVAEAAIRELLKGPIGNEASGEVIQTSIPAGTVLQKIEIRSGTAYVDFNSALEQGGGSCSMAARSAQIEQTLKQFPTIQNVVISIDGRTEDILQP